MTRYEEYLQHGRRAHGEKFSTAGLDARFIPYCNNGVRVKVETCGMVLTGTIGATTGWGPCFLLMRTSRSIGSPWTLGPKDRIIAVQRGRKYQEVR